VSYKVGDAPAAVDENRRRLRALLPAEPRWLTQIHGTRVVAAEDGDDLPQADASVAHRAGNVCVVTVADCVPVLFCDAAATVVAAAHAGWRGLAGGVIENTVRAMGVDPAGVLAWLGPGIGPAAFEVGNDVRDAFAAHDATALAAFRPLGHGKWLADLYALARQRLGSCGVTRVTGGTHCTYGDPQRFFSYRREPAGGRMAALVWLDAAAGPA
jgi:YfiH family protein